jgi:hypothetical protein
MKRGQIGGYRRLASRRLLFLFFAATQCPLVSAQMVRTTLPELVSQSQVIFLGHVHECDGQVSVSAKAVIQFDATEVFKGAGDVQSVISMCNSHPDSEWPDLSRLKGDYVIFASPSGACLKLTVGYRSVAAVSDDVVNTSGITGEPPRQRLAAFSARIRAFVLHLSLH